MGLDIAMPMSNNTHSLTSWASYHILHFLNLKAKEEEEEEEKGRKGRKGGKEEGEWRLEGEGRGEGREGDYCLAGTISKVKTTSLSLL